MKQILERILSEPGQKDMLFLAKDLLRKFDPTSVDNHENLCELCYWLFINDKREESFSLLTSYFQGAGVIDELTDQMKLMYALYVRLLRENGKENEIFQYINKISVSYKPNTLIRFLNGDLLYDKEIQASVEIEDEKFANKWRFSQFKSLCEIRELGGSEIYPIKRIDNEMREIKDILNNIEKVSINATDTNNDSMGQYWNRIENWLKTNAPEIGDLLQNGVEDSEPAGLEAIINAKLPDDFKQFYQEHNGQIPYSKGMIDYEELLSIKRIKEEWQVWKELVDDDEFYEINSLPDKGIKDDWYNVLWIPITADGSGNSLCMDLDPTKDVHYGQIIRMWHDDDARTLVANSFREWICHFTQDLEDGRYEFCYQY